MDTEKLLIYGALAFVAYKLLNRPVSGAAPPPRYTTPPPPPPSAAERISDTAIAIGRDYGAQACIDAGYSADLCRQGAGAAGGLLDSILDF